MATGMIARLVPEKGYGFIKADGDGTEYFFHRSGLGRGSFDELRGGERVEFEIEPSERGPRAGRVQVAVGPPARELAPGRAEGRPTAKGGLGSVYTLA